MNQYNIADLLATPLGAQASILENPIPPLNFGRHKRLSAWEPR